MNELVRYPSKSEWLLKHCSRERRLRESQKRVEAMIQDSSKITEVARCRDDLTVADDEIMVFHRSLNRADRIIENGFKHPSELDEEIEAGGANESFADTPRYDAIYAWVQEPRIVYDIEPEETDRVFATVKKDSVWISSYEFLDMVQFLEWVSNDMYTEKLLFTVEELFDCCKKHDEPLEYDDLLSS